jgi:hypothetical protein
MGSKGASMPPAVQYEPPPDPMETMGPMIEMMGMMMTETVSAMMNQPQLPPFPAINEVESVDWDQHRKDVAEQARIKEEEAAKRRRGLSSTILTSPILDETTPSVIELGLMSGDKG